MNIDPHNVKKIVIVGGGTAGLVSAIIIGRANPHIKIQVLESSDIGIIGVGEGSTEHWTEFMEGCGLDIDEMLRETDATFKLGIKFENWNGDGKHYFHSVVSPYNSQFINRVPSYYSYIVANELEQEKMLPDNYSANKFVPNFLGTHQFHFDTFKLNEWLHKKCMQRGIEFVDTLVEKVNLDDAGYVKSLTDQAGVEYHADFFIDASGFKRVIMNELGAEWIDYKKYLPMNHAIAFPTGYKEDIPAYTTSTALSSGWLWNIPTQQRQGNGYVFCDEYITTDQAIAEVEGHLGHSIDVARDIKFGAGRVNKPMIKNCVAIGLSAVFVEPLEASSIGCSLQQSFLLSNTLSNYIKGNTSMEKRYNEVLDRVFKNIVDFIQLHYITKRNDTKFWKDKNFELTEFNKENMEMFKYSMPTQNFFDEPYNMFRDANWIMVMYGLGLFDIDSIKKCWMNQPEYARKEIDALYTKYKYEDNRLATLTHRQQIATYSGMVIRK